MSTFLTVAQHGLVGDMKSPVDVTYLADAVIMLRFFEARGSVRRAISVIKKRTGKHEDTIREFWIDGGLHVGEPLVEFHGVLRGTPCPAQRCARRHGRRRAGERRRPDAACSARWFWRRGAATPPSPLSLIDQAGVREPHLPRSCRAGRGAGRRRRRSC